MYEAKDNTVEWFRQEPNLDGWSVFSYSFSAPRDFGECDYLDSAGFDEKLAELTYDAAGASGRRTFTSCVQSRCSDPETCPEIWLGLPTKDSISVERVTAINLDTSYASIET